MIGESIYKTTEAPLSLLLLLNLFYPHQCFGVGVGLLVHDDLCHLVVSTVGSHMQRCQVVIGNIVHWHIVVQQQLDAVEVVTLRRHVEGRQTILDGRTGKRIVCKTEEENTDTGSSGISLNKGVKQKHRNK